MTPDDDWREDAACRLPSVDVDIFYPSGNYLHADIAKIERARAVCSECSVREECLADAIVTGEPHGTRGGLTEWERARLRRRQAVQLALA